jgi:hypothetical protein
VPASVRSASRHWEREIVFKLCTAISTGMSMD